MAIQLYRPTDTLAEKSTFEIMPLAMELANKLAATEFVPIALRNKPAAIMACILYGHEVGLPAMASLQLIHVIQGTPGLSAAGQRALILANGHRIWIEEQTVTRATVCAQRRGEERIASATWTLDDAERAKLKHKENWQHYPRNMLVARATGDVARGNFMDVLAGLAYNLEELQDLDPEPGLTANSQTEPSRPPGALGTVRRRARRAATAPAASEPPPAPEPAAQDQQAPSANEPPPAPSVEPVPEATAEPLAGEQPLDPSRVATMTLAQQVAMVCREHNIDRAALIDAVAGKERARDLTRSEATDVLEKAKAIGRGEARLEEREGRWVLLVVEKPATLNDDPGAAFRNQPS